MASSAVKCAMCGSTNLHRTDHAKICYDCGAVAQSSELVSDVSFAERADGGSSVVGQFVGESGGTAAAAGRGVGRSKEQSLARAHRHFQQIANQLGLPQSTIGRAKRLYSVADMKGFMKGRRQEIVCACCLYAICRMDKLPFMLIDFSDFLAVNLYVLGHTFMRFVQVTNLLRLPVIDPSIYLSKFAKMLDFDQDHHLVTQTAVRIIAEMKRNWMEVGRTPGGLCGAALWYAAKIHGYHRSISEITRVVKVCNATLTKRMCEFDETPSAELTFDQLSASKAAELDVLPPPAYRRMIERAKFIEPLIAAEARMMERIGDKEHADLQPDLSNLSIDPELDLELDKYICTEAEREVRMRLISNQFGDQIIEQKLREAAKLSGKKRTGRGAIPLITGEPVRKSARVDQDRLALALTQDVSQGLETDEVLDEDLSFEMDHDMLDGVDEMEFEQELEFDFP